MRAFPGQTASVRRALDFHFVVADGPLDASEVVAEHLGVPIHLVVVAQRAIKHAAFLPRTRPCHAEVPVRPLDAGACHVGLLRVQAEEHVNGLGVVGLFKLVNFLRKFDILAAKHRHKRVLLLPGLDLDADLDVGIPWMAIEATVDHPAVFRPLVEGVRGSVNADESAARFDETHEICLQPRLPVRGRFLRVWRERFKFVPLGSEDVHGGAEEANRIEFRQCVSLEIREIVADGHGERAGFFAHFFESDLAGGDGGVAEAVGLRENEEIAGFRRFGEGLGWQRFGDFFKRSRRCLFGWRVLGDDK